MLYKLEISENKLDFLVRIRTFSSNRRIRWHPRAKAPIKLGNISQKGALDSRESFRQEQVDQQDLDMVKLTYKDI